MITPSKEYVLKNGQKIIVRSPEPSDAQNLIDQIVGVAASTDYLLSVPEDFKCYIDDISKEEDYLERSKSDPGYWLIGLVDDKIVANAQLRMFTHVKDKHRSNIGIAISKDYQCLGIGSLLFDIMIELAKQTPGIEQIELDVISKNERAKRLYTKKGFVKVGDIPHQLKLKDGTYLDGENMVLFLNR